MLCRIIKDFIDLCENSKNFFKKKLSDNDSIVREDLIVDEKKYSFIKVKNQKNSEFRKWLKK